MVLVFDVGGTSLKIGLFDDKTNWLVDTDNIDYQLKEGHSLDVSALKVIIKDVINRLIQKYPVRAISFSTCGWIDNKDIVNGLSGINNYAGTNWAKELANYHLPVVVENDANCALLAEQKFGTAEGKTNVFAIVLGTGIGGAIIVNNHALKGLNGEFGYALEHWSHGEYINFSQVGSPWNLENRLNKASGKKDSLKNYFANYGSNSKVDKLIDEMIFTVAKNLINISFVFHPEVVVIGGGISANQWFMARLQMTVNELMSKSGMNQDWEVVAAKFHNEANLWGAYANALIKGIIKQ